MKNNLKKAIALFAALALVIVAGKFTSDHYLKATDGDENIVEDVAVSEEAADESSAEITIESEAVSEEDIISEEASEEISENESEESEDADEESEDADKTSEDDEDCEHVDEDEDGVCDLCGSEMDEEEDEEEEDEKETGSVYVTTNVDENEAQAEGTKVTFTAHVEGLTHTDYSLQWQRSLDNEKWENISGATSAKYTFTLDEDSVEYYWRVQLITAD